MKTEAVVTSVVGGTRATGQIYLVPVNRVAGPIPILVTVLEAHVNSGTAESLTVGYKGAAVGC
jgi:hypothetical protein